MIESRQALEAVEEIAAVAGLDALVIGSNDLAESLGHVESWTTADVLAAFRRIAAAASENGLRFGSMGLPASLIPATPSISTPRCWS